MRLVVGDAVLGDWDGAAVVSAEVVGPDAVGASVGTAVVALMIGAPSDGDALRLGL